MESNKSFQASAFSVAEEEMASMNENVIDLLSLTSNDEFSNATNSICDSGGSGSSDDSDDPSGNLLAPTLDEGESGSKDVLNQVIQLVKWINEKDDQEKKIDAGGGSKKRFIDGVLFIESLQTTFEHHKTVIAEKNELLADVVEENELLKVQLREKTQDYAQVLTRNEQLEEIKEHQLHKEAMSLEQIQAILEDLQQYFGGLIWRMEQHPVDTGEPYEVQRKLDVDVFKNEVNDLFCRVQRKLKIWKKNQVDMVDELQSTRKVLERLSDMLTVTEQMQRSRSTIEPTVQEVPGAHEEEAETSQNNQLLPPKILPITAVPVPVIFTVAETLRKSTPAFSEEERMASTNNPKENELDTVEFLNAFYDPPLGIPDVVNQPIERERGLPTSNSVSDLSFINTPLPQPPSPSVAVSNAQPKTLNNAMTIALPIPVLTNVDHSEGEMHDITPAHVRPHQQSPLYHPFLPSNAPNTDIGPYMETRIFNNTTVESPINRETVVVSTKQVTTSQVQFPHQRHPAPDTPDETVTRGFDGNLASNTKNIPISNVQNVCRLCGMSFHTLIQMKLHHTVVHLKGSSQTTAVLSPTTPTASPLQAQLPTTIVSPKSAAPAAQALRWNISVIAEPVPPANSPVQPVVPSPHKRPRFCGDVVSKSMSPPVYPEGSSLMSCQDDRNDFTFPWEKRESASSDGSNSAVESSSFNANQISIFPFIRDHRDI